MTLLLDRNPTPRFWNPWFGTGRFGLAGRFQLPQLAQRLPWCPECCDRDGSSGSGPQPQCCAINPCLILTLTLESSCAAIDGTSTQLFPVVSPDNPVCDPKRNVWWWNQLAAHFGNCLGSNIDLRCIATAKPPGCRQYRLEITNTFAGGCGMSIDAFPISCSCKPFELVYSTTIHDILDCECCPIGTEVTIRITK